MSVKWARTRRARATTPSHSRSGSTRPSMAGRCAEIQRTKTAPHQTFRCSRSCSEEFRVVMRARAPNICGSLGARMRVKLCFSFTRTHPHSPHARLPINLVQTHPKLDSWRRHHACVHRNTDPDHPPTHPGEHAADILFGARNGTRGDGHRVKGGGVGLRRAFGWPCILPDGFNTALFGSLVVSLRLKIERKNSGSKAANLRTFKPLRFLLKMNYTLNKMHLPGRRRWQ